MSLIYPAGVTVDDATKKRTERFFDLVIKNLPAERTELLSLIPNICLEARNDHGYTALIWAAGNGYSEIAESLLKAGADIEASDNNGWTPLIWAASRGHSETVEILLKAGADIESRNNRGWTALIWAASHGHSETVEILLKAGADIEARDNGGNTALILAASRRHSETVEILLKAGADIEARDDYGNTALIWAVTYSHETMEKLLKAGANIYAQKNDGGSFVHQYNAILPIIASWQQQYELFVKDRTAPKSAEDVYHLLAVYPLIDPKAPVDRETHLRQIFSYAKWPDKEQPREIIKQLREDGTVSAALAESLLALTQPARKSILENHGRGR